MCKNGLICSHSVHIIDRTSEGILQLGRPEVPLSQTTSIFIIRYLSGSRREGFDIQYSLSAICRLGGSLIPIAVYRDGDGFFIG